MPREYLCNLVIPGAAKSGTTSLHEYLGLHPAIEMSANKEPHFFCRSDFYAQGPRYHNDLFAVQDHTQYFGESSTGYLPSPMALEAVRRDLENPKVIMVLRHPVERSFSHYRWRFRLGLEERTFLQAMQEDGYGYVPEQPDRFGYRAYLEFSQYAHQCPRWEEAFGAENCLIFSFDDLKSRRSHVLQQCFDFLGLPQVELDIDGLEKNRTDDLVRMAPAEPNALTRLVPRRLKQAAPYRLLKERVLKATTPEPPRDMTDKERRWIEDALEEDIGWFENRFENAHELSE